jgi:hypothetical protein
MKDWHRPLDIPITEWLVAFFTLVIMVSSIVYTVYAKRQWKVMRESNKITRDSLISVQRAFVAFSQIKYNRFDNPIPTGEQWTFDGEFINSGTTPAIQAVQRFVVDELPNGLSEDRFAGDFSEQKSNVGTVGPKAPYTVGPALKADSFVFGQPVDLKHPERIRPLKIERHIYFWGWAAYRDIFPDTPRHLTEFCAVLNGISVSRSGQIQLTFVKCPEHNCTDEYCNDYKAIQDGLAALR